jgi:hypothetical protein
MSWPSSCLALSRSRPLVIALWRWSKRSGGVFTMRLGTAKQRCLQYYSVQLSSDLAAIIPAFTMGPRDLRTIGRWGSNRPPCCFGTGSIAIPRQLGAATVVVGI